MKEPINYGFVQKDHWRNRIWNQLSRRVKVPPRDAVIIYLAAEEDFDRETARRKGFHENNLIAVDQNLAVVEKLRAAGKLCLHGDLFELLYCWPEDVQIHGVVADLTCGLQPGLVRKFATLKLFKNLQGAVFCINLVRGHDGDSNVIRDYIQTYLNPLTKEKHRGVLIAHAQRDFFNLVCFNWLRFLFGVGENIVHDTSSVSEHSDLAKVFLAMLEPIDKELRATVSGEYRNKEKFTTMDWVISSSSIATNTIWKPTLELHRKEGRHSAAINFFAGFEVAFNEGKRWDIDATNSLKGIRDKLIPRIAALLAHRTRRFEKAA